MRSALLCVKNSHSFLHSFRFGFGHHSFLASLPFPHVHQTAHFLSPRFLYCSLFLPPFLARSRCKLHRFAADSKEWKERGTGDVKLLKNASTGMVRAVMRQEKTNKLVLNHFGTPAWPTRAAITRVCSPSPHRASHSSFVHSLSRLIFFS